jgi:arylsulfatase A-like enzyme
VSALFLFLSQFVPVERPSVLLIALDDIGAEQIACHPSAIADPPPTPTISALAAEGFQFTNAWGAPVCSPSRAEFLTGRFPFRTGIGGIVAQGETFWLAQAEVTIAERLAARGYRTALFGKWHMDKDHEGPCSQGFESWMGAQGNLKDYWSWLRVDDTGASAAVTAQSAEYATSAVTDAAIACSGRAPSRISRWWPTTPRTSPRTARRPSCRSNARGPRRCWTSTAGWSRASTRRSAACSPRSTVRPRP